MESDLFQQQDRTQTTKEQYTNIQIGNVQNSINTIYDIDNYVCTGLTCAHFEMKNKYVW